MLYEVEVDCRIARHTHLSALHELDREESPWGIKKYPIIAESKGEAIELALDNYHLTVPIKVLDDFDIYTFAYDLKYKVTYHDYAAVIDAQTLADVTNDSCKFRMTLGRAMYPMGTYDQIDVYSDNSENFSFTVVHSSSVRNKEVKRQAEELKIRVGLGEITQEESLRLESILNHSNRPYVKGVERHGTGQEMSVSIGSQEGIYYAIHT